MNDAITPLFCTARLEDTKAFYREHLGMRLAVELPGYAELQRGEGGPLLAFMAPEVGKFEPASGKGLIYCFQVDDADAEHARLAAAGVEILEGPGEKPWGERAFLAVDPNGITLYFGHRLPAKVESLAAAK
ncbi:MAG: VOC family protein [Planctomycetota bacterium]